MKITQLQIVVLALAILVTVGLAFFGGYTQGYADVNEDMRNRVTTAETTTNNCLNKIAGWCDNKAIRLVDCGDDLQVCVCMSQREVKGLRQSPEEK